MENHLKWLMRTIAGFLVETVKRDITSEALLHCLTFLQVPGYRDSSMCPAICLSFYLFIYLSLCLSICLFVYRSVSVYLFICLFIYLLMREEINRGVSATLFPYFTSLYFPVCSYLFSCLNLNLYLHLIVSISISVSIPTPIYLSVWLSIYGVTCLCTNFRLPFLC